MFPGPTIIRQCAICAHPFQQETLYSGNTFGATWWTDGKVEAPMLPECPALIQCPHCRALLWIEEQAILGEVDWGDKTTYPTALDYRVPNFADYCGLLASGAFQPEQERILRLHAWWAGNDPRRQSVAPAPLSAPEVENLRQLAVLAKETDEEDRMMKAEILRELGQFDAALALLRLPVSPEYHEAAVRIHHLATQGDAFVRKIPSTSSGYEDEDVEETLTAKEEAPNLWADPTPAGDLLAFPKDILEDALRHFHLLHSLRLSHLNRHGVDTLQALIEHTHDRLEVGRDYLSMKDEDDPDVLNMTVLTIPQEVIDGYALGTLDILRNVRLNNLDHTGESVLHTLIHDTILRLEIAKEQLDISRSA